MSRNKLIYFRLLSLFAVAVAFVVPIGLAHATTGPGDRSTLTGTAACTEHGWRASFTLTNRGRGALKVIRVALSLTPGTPAPLPPKPEPEPKLRGTLSAGVVLDTGESVTSRVALVRGESAAHVTVETSRSQPFRQEVTAPACGSRPSVRFADRCDGFTRIALANAPTATAVATIDVSADGFTATHKLAPGESGEENFHRNVGPIWVAADNGARWQHRWTPPEGCKGVW